jgi:hypothetical protein
VVVMLDGFSLAAIAAQLGIALYLTGAQNSNGRKMIFEMGFAERALRRRDGRG